MKLIGNIFWFLLGGLPAALGWWFFGIFWAITIVGIPVAKQCFKLAAVQLAPFGKRIERNPDAGLGIVLNLFWIILGGLELALANLLAAAFFAITIIGLPFAKQSLKLAGLSLAPFNKRIVRE
jgi:uncharacterized membrane protein YccF (DUF307 family)